MSRTTRYAIAAVLLGTLAPLLLCELVLRLLPVSSGMTLQEVNADHPVAKFMPNQDFIYSHGWSFSHVNRGHINNDGFVNDQNYDPLNASPLLAIVGDSYVEALMVPYRQTLQGRLAAQVGDRGRVYSFGGSGAPLSQYIVWAEYAAHLYHPSGIAITVVGNDFDESLAKYKNVHGHHYFDVLPSGKLELRRVDYHPGRLRTIVLKSALARYVIFNLQPMEQFQRVRSWLSGDVNAGFVGNTSNSLGPERVADSLKVIPAFLEELLSRTGLPPERLLLIVDGIRPELYSAATAGSDSYFGIMRSELMTKARARGLEVIDLQPVFAAAYREHKQRFEFPDDGHWNSHGHAVVASAVSGSSLFHKIFAQGTP
jgi:hypothetical protein